MRRVQLSRVRPGMVLAKSIFFYDSHALATAEQVIDEAFIQQLSETGYSAIIVYDDRTLHPSIPEPLRESAQFMAYRVVRDTYRQAQAGVYLDIEKLVYVAEQLVQEVVSASTDRQFVAHQYPSTFHEYVYEHMVRVATLAIAVGMQLGYDSQALRDLAIGGLLMDIGEMEIRQGILEKSDLLATDEVEEMRRHCYLGFHLVRSYAIVPLPSAAALLHHSERMNGSGYPQNLLGEDIHPFGRILAVCDTYDALITDHRYRNRYLPEQALGIIHAGAGALYDRSVVEAVASIVTPYPVGTMVELSDGRTACVVYVRRDAMTKPKVRIMLDAQRNLIETRQELNLEDSEGVIILRAIEDSAVPIQWQTVQY